MTRYRILWLAAIEWDAPWQGQQTLASRLADDGHLVTFVETFGVRAAGRRDWGRLASRLRNRLRGGLKGFRKLTDNLSLFSPVIAPFPGRPWVDRVNQRLLMRAFRRLSGDSPLMVWTFLPTPIVVGLVKELRPARLIYSCIDSMITNPAGVAPGIVTSEDWLARHADHVFATSRELYVERKAKNQHMTYLPEGADIAPFMEPRSEPAQLMTLAHPRICFFGTLDGRLDQELLVRVAAAHPNASIILIGPVRCDVTRLRRLPNVHFLGFRSHEVLPAFLSHMDLFVIPYLINEYTIHIHPVKTYEALATGKPLVATDLPELRPYAGPVVVARDANEFLAGIGAGLAETDSGLIEARKEIAGRNTWDARYRTIKEQLPDLA